MKIILNNFIVALTLVSMLACTTFEKGPEGLAVNINELNLDSGANNVPVVISTAEWLSWRMPKWISVKSIDNDNYRTFEWTINFYVSENGGCDRTGSIYIYTKSFSYEIPVSQSGSMGPFIPEWVDLGLPSGLKWATCNVGAYSPEEYGYYYAWGEVVPKSKYSWVGYKFRASGDSYSNVTFSKYNSDSEYGTVDNKTILEMSDDAARANWGGTWRMPTEAEFDELTSNCSWTWIIKGGEQGFKVTSKTNGNSIFFPFAGAISDYEQVWGGYYWCSSLGLGNPKYASCSRFIHSSSGSITVGWYDRSYGCSVRPVMD